MARKLKETIDENRILRQGKRGIFSIIFSRTMLIIVLLLFNFFLLFSFLLGLFEGIPVFMGSMVAFTAVMLVRVLNTDDNPSVKLSWCILIGVLPVFGAALYFFVRSDLGHRIGKRMVNQSIEESLLHIPEQTRLYDAIREEDRHFYNLARYLKNNANAAVYSGTDVRYFPLGEDKFEEMLRQMEQAEHFIFLEYFVIGQGYMWGKILDVLARKAAEGVEVRVLYDGTCAITTLPADYPRQLEKLGIRCAVFSPVRPFVSTHYNYRDHRKILIVDGHTAFTGGVNIEDRYINKEEVFGHWKDTAVIVHGEAARGFTLLFLQQWNAATHEHDFEPNLAAETLPVEGYVIPYGDGPNTPERVGEMVYLNILNQAKDYVHIMTPYLILDNEMVTALRFAAKRGVDVKLILPHIPDKKYAFALAKSHYKELIEAGVHIYEYTPGFVHAKVFLCDDIHAVVGTINLDYRSLYLHYECAAYLYKVAALAEIKEDFRDTLSKSQRITMEDVKKQSLLSRFMAALLKVLAPLM